jgi:hypothetical protein
MNSNLKKFDFKNIANDATILILGGNDSERTKLIRTIMNLKNKPQTGLFFTNTPESTYENKDVLNALGKAFCEKRDCENIEAIKNTFFIIDNVLKDEEWVYDENLNRVIHWGRTLKFFFVIATHTALFPQHILNNFDYIFMMSGDYEFKEKWSVPSYYSDFDSILKECIEQYGCMVLYANADTWDDVVFYFNSKK